MNPEQPTLFDNQPEFRETPHQRAQREADEIAARVSEDVAQQLAAIEAGQRTEDSTRNPGTQAMIEELGGGQPRETLMVNPPPAIGSASRKPRPSGNVRGFSDGERRDSELYPSEGPLSPEQKEINNRGIDLARRAIKASRVEGIVNQAKAETNESAYDPEVEELSEERTITARLRTYFDEHP